MPDWVLTLLPQAALAAGVYAGIRADLAALHIKADNATKTADEAHRRIDNIHDNRRSNAR